jgi:peptide deformylase
MSEEQDIQEAAEGVAEQLGVEDATVVAGGAAGDITEAVEALLESEDEREPNVYQGQARDIKILGEAALRLDCEWVTEINDEVANLVADMSATMVEYNGLGLAAPQIDVPQRVVVFLDNDGDEKEGVMTIKSMINPRIVSSEGSYSMLEGCLSVPGARGTVERAARIVVEYVDLSGEQQKDYLTDSQAAMVQHELDHLDGVLFIDHLSPFKKRRAMQQHHKVMKQAYRQAKRDFR